MNEFTFIKPDPTLKNNLMAFGWECDFGWYPLIKELFEKIQLLVDANPDYKDFEVLQVKEKLGELRVYCSCYPEDIDKLIDEYVDKSCITCEICGGNGKIREKAKGHWLKTLCDICHLTDW